MSWSKLKNIIILLLAGTNLILAGMALYYWQRETASSRQAMENAVAILEDQGVSFEAEIGDMTLSVLEVQRDQGREELLASALLGSVEKEDRGAGVYRYAGERGNIQFHSNGEFSAAFVENAFPLGENTPQDHALATMELLDFQGEVIGRQTVDGVTTVSVRQLFNGTPVLSCQADLVYENGCLTAIIRGQRINGTPYLAGGKEEPVSASSALVHFLNGLRELGDVCNTIDSVEEGYRLSSVFTGPARLTPVWYFTTDTGSYQLNALTGELTRNISAELQKRGA